MDYNKPTFVQKSKKKIKENSDKIMFVVAGISALGATYYYGKTKGALNVELLLISKDDEGEFQKKNVSSL